MKNKIKHICAVFLVALTGCYGGDDDLTEPHIGSITQANHAWSNYHWVKSGDTVALNLRSNLSATWLPYLNTASSDWNFSDVLSTTVVNGNQNPTRCKPTLGRVEVCNAKYGKNGWLGIAQVWVNENHITQATVKLNDTYFALAPYNTSAWKRMVMCQEVGHTFGLDHQDENMTNPNLGTCMDYTNNPAGPLSNEHPNAHDYEELDTIYAHNDNVTNTFNVSSNKTHKTNNEMIITHVLYAE